MPSLQKPLIYYYYFLTTEATCKSANLHWWKVGCESCAASLQLCPRRIMDKKETPGGQKQRPVRKIDRWIAELKSSRLVNGDTYELWEFSQYGPICFFEFKINF